MTECLMFAYAERIPAVRARRLLDAAEAATVPHIKRDAVVSWRAKLIRLVEMLPSGSDTAFTLNGASITVDKLRKSFGRFFGSAYVDE